jgi:hypothetical protein
MNITYRDENNNKYKMKRKYYINQDGGKVYNLAQITEIINSSEYKVSKAIRLAKIKPTVLRAGKRVYHFHTDEDIKVIKKQLKSKGNFNLTIEKLPYKQTVFHLFASGTFMNLY